MVNSMSGRPAFMKRNELGGALFFGNFVGAIFINLSAALDARCNYNSKQMGQGQSCFDA